MTAAAKLCVDCVYFVDSGITKQYGKCSAIWKYAPTTSPVTGAQTGGERWYAATQREHECGAEGRFWESKYERKVPKEDNVIATDKQKPSWWHRLVRRFM